MTCCNGIACGCQWEYSNDLDKNKIFDSLDFVKGRVVFQFIVPRDCWDRLVFMLILRKGLLFKNLVAHFICSKG